MYLCIRAYARRTHLDDIPRVHRPWFSLLSHGLSVAKTSKQAKLACKRAQGIYLSLIPQHRD